MIVVDLSTPKELDADEREIQQIEFAQQLKKFNKNKNNYVKHMFISTILEKIKETRLKFLKEVKQYYK